MYRGRADAQRRHARQAEAQTVEIVLEIVAAFRAAMHGDAGRLVEHQHQRIAIEQAGGEVQKQKSSQKASNCQEAQIA